MASLMGWTYYKSVSLSRASGAVTNYQMKLLVGRSSGSVGATVHCGGHCLATFTDLRFVNSVGTVLDYWIESITGAAGNELASVWIEFDSIATSATTFRMYYGNATAPAVSSGANTFIVFDDFERGADGDTVGGAWTELIAHCHISTEQDIGNVTGFTGTRAMKLVGGEIQPSVTIPVTASGNIAIRFRAYKENATYFETQHGDVNHCAYVMAEVDEDITYYDGSTKDTGSNCSADAWDLWELRTFDWSANTFEIRLNDLSVKTGTTTYTSSNWANLLNFKGLSIVGDDTWIDDFIVRNFRTTEPAWGSWGTETRLLPRVMLWS
jgi:hypothetical protein